MTREFILNTLLSYKEDPNTCAIHNGNCKYLDDKGRKCALGKHLIEGIHQIFDGGVYDLNEKYGLNNILTEEATLQNIPIVVWAEIQGYHDYLASANIEGCNRTVKSLEDKTDFKFPELYFEF